MKLSDLKPAKELIKKLGVKAILYGQAGTGKTPMINTAPNPVLLATEPGLLSLKGSNILTWEAFTTERIEEFFKWFFESAESKKFDTLAIDSGSQIAELSLAKHQARCKDGRKAYGEMSLECMKWFDQLYFMPQKHVVLICKQMKAETGKQVVREGGAFTVEFTYQAQPFFPGNDLNIKVPHRYDEIFYVSRAQVPGFTNPTLALRTQGTPEFYARDRSGMLDELEPPDLSYIFKKAMS